MDSTCSMDKPHPFDTSFDSIIEYAFDYSKDENLEYLKESDNIFTFLNFLREIWTHMMDSSKCPSLKGESGHKHLPFMSSDSTRKFVSDSILKFLETHREELSPVSRESESPSAGLSNIAQGHLLTCFKLLSSFLMQKHTHSKHSIYALINLVKVLMNMVPSALDLSSSLDFLTDLVKTLSLEDCMVFSEFVVEMTDYFYNQFNDAEMRQSNTRIVQTCEAKLIGLVKLFETTFEQAPGGVDYSTNVFNLRFLLTHSLSTSHLGICNKQSVATEAALVNKMGHEEWSKLDRTATRTRCESISDYEIASYESVASPIRTNMPSNQIYDIKSLLSKSVESFEVENRKCVDKGDKGNVKSVKIPSYEVYSNYCDIYNFIQNPEIILVKTQEYVDDLQKWYNNVLSHINALAETSNNDKITLRMSDFDFNVNVNLVEFDGGISDFVNKSMNLKFWSNFLIFSSLALQTLRVYHKKDESTAYELLKEKCVTVLNSIDKNLWTTMAKISNTAEVARTILQKEQLWMNWKMNGCKDEFNTLTGDELTMVEDNNNFSKDEESGLEDEDGEGELDFVDQNNLLNTLRELEKISYEFGDEDSTIGINYVPVISDMELNKESIYWYIHEEDQTKVEMNCDQQLKRKFEDYCKKLEIDEDPENDIAEPEKSKHNPLFKFRFGRLFGVNHVEKFVEMTNEDIGTGSIESMRRVAKKSKMEEPEEASSKGSKKQQ
ncbi:conserved hypothetical protein [Theileria orientalis strain Shintoku]|uniref:Uncharacterized protein n=1 Tax=Theileria orientalis strain Shintoku TaxID=869250 RepID=J4C7L6_THEOR|nr:conserved hypothetical protein [Theileria orientalis strain Shintoku]BAM39253.1 conserved hypothetical protein [Theileria orientalis strain Shintoku]|eukprot:XP_009689554.1 conserved hypothetical protein [Theileria orientalis strain Shintoku]